MMRVWHTKEFLIENAATLLPFSKYSLTKQRVRNLPPPISSLSSCALIALPQIHGSELRRMERLKSKMSNRKSPLPSRSQCLPLAFFVTNDGPDPPLVELGATPIKSMELPIYTSWGCGAIWKNPLWGLGLEVKSLICLAYNSCQLGLFRRHSPHG